MLGVARGIVVGTTSGMGVSGLPAEFTAIGQGYIGPMPIPVVVLIVTAVVVGLFLAYHLWGTYIYSIGGNETAADPDGPAGRARQDLRVRHLRAAERPWPASSSCRASASRCRANRWATSSRSSPPPSSAA